MAIFNKQVVNDFSKDNGSIIFFNQIENDESCAYTFFSSAKLVRAINSYYSAKVEEYNEKQAQMVRELFFTRSLVGYSGVTVKKGLTTAQILMITGGVVAVGALEHYTKFFSSTAKGCAEVIKAPFKALFGKEENKTSDTSNLYGLAQNPAIMGIASSYLSMSNSGSDTSGGSK